MAGATVPFRSSSLQAGIAHHFSSGSLQACAAGGETRAAAAAAAIINAQASDRSYLACPLATAEISSSVRAQATFMTLQVMAQWQTRRCRVLGYRHANNVWRRVGQAGAMHAYAQLAALSSLPTSYAPGVNRRPRMRRAVCRVSKQVAKRAVSGAARLLPNELQTAFQGYLVLH